MEWLQAEKPGNSEVMPEAYELQPSPKGKKLVPELPIHKILNQPSIERHIEQTPEQIEEKKEEEDKVSLEDGWGQDEVSISEETPRREKEVTNNLPNEETNNLPKEETNNLPNEEANNSIELSDDENIFNQSNSVHEEVQ